MTQTLTEIPISKLRPRPENLRVDANGDDLVLSIKTFGVLQPINVTPDGDYYLINAGHRRLDGAKKAGLKSMPAVVTNGDSPTDEASVTAMMLIENLHRTDLDVVEQATGFRRLVDLGWKQKEIADKTGIHPSIISRRVKITALPPELLDAIRNDELSLERAESLVPLAELDPAAALELYVEKGRFVSTYTIEQAVDELKVDQLVEKLQTKLEQGGYPFVPPAQVGDFLRPGPRTLDEGGAEYRWDLIYDEVEVADPETGEIEVEQTARTVKTGPLDLAAAFEHEKCHAFSIAKVDGKHQLVAVEKVVILSAAAVEKSQSTEQKQRAKEREQKALAKAKANHDREQFETIVAGKLTKGDVTDWLERAFIEGLHAEAKKMAARYLQLEPVEVEAYGKNEDGSQRMEKSLSKAYDQAFEEASGMGRTRMLLAAVLGECSYYSYGTQWNELRDDIKTTLGFVEFDATAES